MIPINPYSRPGKPIHSVKAIVIHWPFWPNASAQVIHDYFANISGEKRYASAHYAIGLKGEVVPIVPEEEIAYHCGSAQVDPASGKVYTDLARELFGKYASAAWSPNYVSIGIEVCHIDKLGTMMPDTIETLRVFCMGLCTKYGLTADKVIRHYDVVGYKTCPRYWVANETEWKSFIESIREAL
jgi:N-acetylmuramoyl-L-alanine amidase CwlA